MDEGVDGVGVLQTFFAKFLHILRLLARFRRTYAHLAGLGSLSCKLCERFFLQRVSIACYAERCQGLW